MKILIYFSPYLNVVFIRISRLQCIDHNALRAPLYLYINHNINTDRYRGQLTPPHLLHTVK